MSTTIFKGTAIGLIGALVFVLVWLLGQDHSAREKLEAAQRRFCIAERLKLETMIHGLALENRAPRIRYDVNDAPVHQLCLGVEVPIDFQDADGCYIGTSRDSCYSEPLRQLHSLYRNRGY
jgi:hypothetical protein